MIKTIVVACILASQVIVGYAKPAATSCTDKYIWAFDGSVECDKLVKESIWGMHKNPEYWCNDYVLTDCCATCTSLRQANIITG